MEPPEWVQKLVEGPLVQKAEHFSKFGHGTAILFNSRAPLLPKWWPQFEQDHAKLIRFANGVRKKTKIKYQSNTESLFIIYWY